jgi:hypothetical protein
MWVDFPVPREDEDILITMKNNKIDLLNQVSRKNLPLKKITKVFWKVLPSFKITCDIWNNNCRTTYKVKGTNDSSTTT